MKNNKLQDDIENIIEDKNLLKYLIKILEYEKSKIHQTRPNYTDAYSRILMEALEDENITNYFE